MSEEELQDVYYNKLNNLKNIKDITDYLHYIDYYDMFSYIETFCDGLHNNDYETLHKIIDLIDNLIEWLDL